MVGVSFGFLRPPKLHQIIERNIIYMAPTKELKFAYGLAIVLSFVGVISYAAAPEKTPDEPIRLMFKVIAGNVLFDHKTHASELGTALACIDCHHHYEDEESEILAGEAKPAEREEPATAEVAEPALVTGDNPIYRPCGACHLILMEDQPLPQSCFECHDPDEIEETEMPKRTDAFHLRCDECHKEAGIGPEKEDDRCIWCHFMI
jgi:hypothetical protein